MNTDNAQDAVVINPTSTHTHTIIWLHGLGADGHDFEPIVPELQLPESLGVKFIFPNAPMRPITINNGYVMRGWYDILRMDLIKDQDETGIMDSVSAIKAIIQAEIDAGIPAKHIVVAGFSQGGAIALFAGLSFDQQLAGVIGLSTYLPLPQAFADEARQANQNTPVFLGHGLLDPVVPVQAGEISLQTLQKLDYQPSWQTYPMEHSVCIEEISDIAKWLKGVLQ